MEALSAKPSALKGEGMELAIFVPLMVVQRSSALAPLRLTARLPTGSAERTAMGRWGSGRCTHFRCPGMRNRRWRACTGRPRT